MALDYQTDGGMLTVVLAAADLAGGAEGLAGPLPGSADVSDAIAKTLADTGCRTLIVDFSKVPLLPSLGISELLHVHHHCREHGVGMVVCGLSPDIARVFRVTALTRLLQVYPSAAAARDACAADVRND